MRPEDLRSHDLLTPEPVELPEFRLLLSRGTQRAEVAVSPKLAVGDPAVLHAAAAAGLGIGLLPGFLCRQGLATGRLKAVLPDWTAPPAAALHALYPAAMEADTRVRRFDRVSRRERHTGAGGAVKSYRPADRLPASRIAPPRRLH